jgi:hypothetical protein
MIFDRIGCFTSIPFLDGNRQAPVRSPTNHVVVDPVFVPVARYAGKASGNVRTVEGHPNPW